MGGLAEGRTLTLGGLLPRTLDGYNAGDQRHFQTKPEGGIELSKGGVTYRRINLSKWGELERVMNWKG